MDKLDSLLDDIRAFVRERDWEQFHDPKNLAMAVASEAGELCAELRWVPSADADAWFAQAQQVPGSWWTDWSAWLAPLGGEQVAAPKVPGSAKYKPIEPAPGRYVLQKASN